MHNNCLRLLQFVAMGVTALVSWKGRDWTKIELHSSRQEFQPKTNSSISTVVIT